jgi:hypothetical protein
MKMMINTGLTMVRTTLVLDFYSNMDEKSWSVNSGSIRMIQKI